MTKLPAAALSAAVLLSLAAPGCRRHPRPDTVGAAPRPVWSATEVTTVEGRRISLTLTLSRVPNDAVDVSLTTNSPGDVSFPATVTFAAGDDSQSVSITALAVEPGPQRDPEITARTPNGSSTVTLHITDDDADLGNAVGPVAWGTGVAVFAGAGADGTFGNADDEFIAARSIGSATPVLARTLAPSLSGTALCAPVVTPGGAVLVLANGPAPTLLQFQSVPDAPAITASSVLGAKVGGVSRPVMIGTRAVIVSRGSDAVTSVDDALLVVDGIGTTTLSVRTVLLPGLSASDPSVPVQLDATSLLITTSGPDFAFGTGDEVLTLVRGLDTASPTVVPLAVARIRGDASGRAMASGGTVAAACTAGLDGTFGTADDALQVVRDVLGTPAPALPLTIGPLASGAEALPLAPGSDSAIVPTLGVDLVQGTSDDEVAVVSPLATDPMTVTTLAAGRSVAGAEGAMVVVSASAVVRLEAGVDGAIGSSDDGLRVFSALGTVSPSTSIVTTGALQGWGPMPADSGSVVLCGIGPDHSAGTADDTTVRVAGIGGPATASNNPTGPFAPLGKPAVVLTSGGRSAVARTAGPDAAGGNADDRLSAAVSP